MVDEIDFSLQRFFPALGELSFAIGNIGIEQRRYESARHCVRLCCPGNVRQGPLTGLQLLASWLPCPVAIAQ